MIDTSRTDHIRLISARHEAPRWLKWLSLIALVTILASSIHSPVTTLNWVVQSLIFGFTGIVLFKAYLYFHSGKMVTRLPALLAPSDCPTYTALVPCYRESKVIAQLIDRLGRMDYQPDKLAILLLMEEDDADTREAVERLLPLPDTIRPVVVPLSWMPGLRGKPRALMYAVDSGMVDSEYCVIWDAEDIPDRDQLRKAATAFANYPDIACFQAELRWWNAEQNWLTRMMAVSYANHFAMILPGMCATNSVVPLGGTSNHLRVSALADVGWWDPYNVTEDLDLGVKLRRAGYRVRILPSKTLEEATGTLRQQRNQMSRWIKGHTVTANAHLDHPWRLCRELGLRGTLSFLTMIVAALPAALVAPFFWVMTVVYAIGQPSFIREITPLAAFYLGTLCLVSNILLVVAAMYAVLKTEQFALWVWLPLLPIHWVIVGTAASLKAARELLFNQKTYWDKTPRTHLYEDQAPASLPRAGAWETDSVPVGTLHQLGSPMPTPAQGDR